MKGFIFLSLIILALSLNEGNDDLGSHFATNPNNQYGKEKTITVDGTKSGWELDMKIAQNIANNDPRVFAHWSMHEMAIDDYALFAAYDDEYLYLMWEMTNMSDVVANEDYPISQGNLWINNLPIFIFLSVQKDRGNGGKMVGGGTIWNSGISLEEKVDTIIACSTNASNGPFIYHYDESLGAFPTETKDKYAESGITLKFSNGILDTQVFGLKECGSDNRKVSMDYSESSNWIDFYSQTNHNKNLDMTYEMKIPLAKLGIDKEHIKKNGIGIIKVSTFGTSGMDSLPYDKSMSDNAHLPYSGDSSTSKEKEDLDHITCKLARIGGDA
jgi:alpha-amylase